LGLIGQLPQDLSQASFLKTFLAAGNQLSGVLPDSWGGPTAFPLLHVVDLSRNKLLGARCQHIGLAQSAALGEGS